GLIGIRYMQTEQTTGHIKPLDGAYASKRRDVQGFCCGVGVNADTCTALRVLCTHCGFKGGVGRIGTHRGVVIKIDVCLVHHSIAFLEVVQGFYCQEDVAMSTRIQHNLLKEKLSYIPGHSGC